MLDTPTVYQGTHTGERPQMRLPWFNRPRKGGSSQTFQELIDSSLGKQGSLNGAPSSQQDGSQKERHRNTKSDCEPDPDHQRSNDTTIPSSNYDMVPPPPAPPKLKRFQKAASTHEMRRYSDLKNRLESPLLEYMYKHKGEKQHRLGQVALRPVVLGTTLDDAKLWMVILCDKNLESRAMRFLKQQWVYDLCNMSGHNQTNIEILVAGSIWPVSRIVAQLPLKPDDARKNDWTFCGVPMCFFDTDSHSICMATLGGALQVSFNDGSSALMGMTSGHVTQSFGGSDSNDHGVDDGEINFDSESESEPEPSNRPHVHSGMTDTSQASLDFAGFKPAGQIRASLWEVSSAMLPIVTPENKEMASTNITTGLWTELERAYEISVIVLSAEAPKRGYLYTMPARLQMHPGNSFINTHLMRLRENYSISLGDSGSWVIDATTMHVYGHLVAADIFGDGYVVPLLDSLNDIKRCLKAREVVLAFKEPTWKPDAGTLNTDHNLPFDFNGQSSGLWLLRGQALRMSPRGPMDMDALSPDQFNDRRSSQGSTLVDFEDNATSRGHTILPLQDTVTHGDLFYVNPQGTQMRVETVDVQGTIDKGFFLSEGEWTCYRRNYFSCMCAFSLDPPNVESLPLRYIPSGSSSTYDVFAFAMTITAVVADSDAHTIELVQSTPERDKGPTFQLKRVKLAPKQPHEMAHSEQHPEDDANFATATSRLPSTLDAPPTEHTFGRVQFKQATANNGKRRAAQQYYHLVIELHAHVGELGRGKADHWVTVAHRKSARLVVRLRSPGHYQTERRMSADIQESSGADIDVPEASNVPHDESASSKIQSTVDDL